MLTAGLCLVDSCARCVFFNDTATTEIYTLSLHDALPICRRASVLAATGSARRPRNLFRTRSRGVGIARIGRSVHFARSEEHTSELQSRQYLVCRLLLEKKKSRDENLTR